MRSSHFAAALWGYGGGADEQPNGERARYAVADALTRRAAVRRAEGRPDIAARLSWASGQVATGHGITKKVAGRLRADIDAIRCDLVEDDPAPA